MTARNIGQPVPTVLDAQQARAKDRLECARRIKPVRTTGGLIHHVADIAAIEQQQIGVRLQQIQRFEQHLPLGAVGRMKRGVQRQLRPWQEQRERVMVGTPFMALAGRNPQAGAGGGGQPQAVAAHRINTGFGELDQARAGQVRTDRPTDPDAPC